jgi:mRNA interferase MazF
MKRGEVRWYVFSRPDRKRPVLILTRDSAVGFLGEVTVAPIASTMREIPSEVFLSKTDDMPRDCAVNLDHLQAVSQGKIGSLISRALNDFLAHLCHRDLYPPAFVLLIERFAPPPRKTWC